MATQVYGASDDLIECDGDVRGEVGAYGTDKKEHGVLVVFNDGTVLEVKYGKLDAALWGITLHRKGSLFIRIDECTLDDEDKDMSSDVAHFADGLKWAYAARDWELVA